MKLGLKESDQLLVLQSFPVLLNFHVKIFSFVVWNKYNRLSLFFIVYYFDFFNRLSYQSLVIVFVVYQPGTSAYIVWLMLKITFLLALSSGVVYYFFNSSKKLEELAPEENFIAYKNLDIKKKKELINKVDFKQIVELHSGSKNMRNLYAEKQSNSQQIKKRYIQQLLDTSTDLEQLEKLRLEFFIHANENELSLNYLHTLPVYYLIVVIHDGIPLFQENLTPEELSLTVSKYSRDEIIRKLQELRYTGLLKDALDDLQ